jgi:hypothetical protein
MKALVTSPWIALTLKLVGAILILTSLIDYIILFTTINFQDGQTIINFTTGVVDRGFIPLVGLVLLFIGFWFESGNSSDPTSQTSPALRLTALVIASILGLTFLLVAPWSVLTTRDVAEARVKQITEEATKAKTLLDSQVQQLKGQGAQQLEAQLAEIDRLINSGQLQGDQLTQAQQRRDQLKRLKADPKALEAEVNAQIGPKQTDELNKIRNREQELVNQTWGSALRSALRTGLNSLLLAIGYIFVGWTGIRQLLYSRN